MAETSTVYYWLESLCKDIVVNPCHSPKEVFKGLATQALRETRHVGKVCNLYGVKTGISAVLMVKSGSDPHIST